MRRLLSAAFVAALCMTASLGWHAAMARADGDPGSDVLVYSNLFVAGDSGISIAQQESLGALLNGTTAAHAPVRVAIVAKRDDLGSITAVWDEPATYARYLGYELSLAYSGRLLIVMPDGLGFYWNGHATTSGDRALAGLRVGAGPGGLVLAAVTAVRALERSAGVGAGALAAAVRSATAGAVRAAQSASAPNGAIATVPAGTPPPGARPARRGGSVSGWLVAAVLLLALSAPFWGPRAVRAIRTTRAVRTGRGRRGRPLPLAGPRWAIPGVVVLTLMAVLVVVALMLDQPASTTQTAYLAHNPDLDPGSPLGLRPAPGFTLTDQFGRQISLSQYRGKVVILAFNDSECQTICPLTTEAMLDAKRALGPAGADVQLLGIDANQKSTSIEDVLSYSQLHGMTTAWHFLTGSLAQLKAVWGAYGISVDIQRGLIAHTPALFVIDPQGRLRTVYTTQSSYAAIPQLGQLLAREASALLPARPAVATHVSYAEIGGVGPSQAVSLPRAGGGSVQLGPGAAHLYVFFATWDKESMPIAGQLDALNTYVADARREGLPSVTAVDEGSVEPSSAALPAFLRALPRHVDYPVAIDTTGRVADGYEVQGQPWFVLTSASGRIAWWQEVYGSGWPTVSDLEQQVRAALTRVSGGSVGERAAAAELAGSPAPLAALHVEASQLLGGQAAMNARVKSLRGYPIVVNVWQSACEPCQAEFGLMASAAARFGKHVAFLGADADDVAGNARAFLAAHPVSYPSYQVSNGSIESLLPAGISGLPTTFFVSARGKVVGVHTGQYAAQGTLDQDIRSYLLSR